MKKLILIIAVSCGLFIASCGNQEGSKEPGTYPPAEDSFANAIPSGKIYDSAAGSRATALIAARDCKTCHNMNEKMTGPSYHMIADKYGYNEGMVDELAKKIVSGGSGRWGTVAMPPHNDLSINDAREMARYILSLNNNK